MSTLRDPSELALSDQAANKRTRCGGQIHGPRRSYGIDMADGRMVIAHDPPPIGDWARVKTVFEGRSGAHSIALVFMRFIDDHMVALLVVAITHGGAVSGRAGG